jgi:SHS2 domain-containing protein
MVPAPAAAAAPSASDDYFEHGADIGVIGRGPTVESAFEAAAAAMFAIQVPPAQVRPALSVQIEFEEADLELALVSWLNALLSAARVHRAAFSEFALRRCGDRWAGTARGEPWRPGHERGTEVKGATLTALSVRTHGGAWEARCVVDV